MAKFFRFVFIVLLGWSGVSPALAQQSGEQREVSFTHPGRVADSPEHVLERRFEQRRQAIVRKSFAANPAVAANEADSLALVALFNATGGAGWTDKSNWLTGPVVEWFGVTINEDGRVTEVDLRENRLVGLIPAELADLTELEGLLLADNTLFGFIPEAVTTLARLKTLSLWGNVLGGPLPAALAQQVELESILVFSNQLTGPIPPELGDLPNLRHLWLDANQFTGSIPSELANLTTLEELFLDFNQLTGPIPPELVDLDNLIILSIGDNPIGGEFPVALTAMTNLEDLWIPRIGMTGTVPLELTGMTNLSTLLLNGNQLTGEIPEELALLNNLTQLHLAENLLTGTIPESLGAILNLKELDLRGNQLTGSIPPELGILGILAKLDLGFNRLTGEIPFTFSNLQRLRDLYLDGNQLTGDLTFVLDLPLMTNVYLRGNAFSGDLPRLALFWQILAVGDLGENEFTGAIPPSTGQFRFIETLLLDGNALTGAVPSEMNSLSTLRILSLSNNHLDALPDLTGMTALDSMNVAENRLTFEDIEPNVSLARRALVYAPQDTVETLLTRTAAALTFSVATGGANNRYQWYRDGVVIDGATADTLVVDPGAAVAAYHCEITNTVATALTLTSRPLRSDAVATDIEAAPDAAGTLPERFALYPNYPNPFNPTTRIAFDVAAPSRVRLTVYDVLGRAVAVLVDRRLPAGRHEAAFETGDLPSGLYVYRIEMDTFSAARTMMLVR